jgi:predicted nucleic acid-binding protein
MLCLLDTNILLRALDRSHPHFRAVRRGLIVLQRQGARPCVAAQNLVEFWAVATRPRDANGLGMSCEWAAAQISRMRQFFVILSESTDVQSEWERLVAQYRVSGKKVHDARLVAMMNIHRVSHILTFNIADFSRYPGLKAINPWEVDQETLVSQSK